MSAPDITLWLPETDLIRHQALGKLAEELAEAGKIAARCLIQGLDACDPKTGEPNIHALADELADVDACISWLSELLPIAVEPHNARMDRKLTGFRAWQKMLEQMP